MMPFLIANGISNAAARGWSLSHTSWSVVSFGRSNSRGSVACAISFKLAIFCSSFFLVRWMTE